MKKLRVITNSEVSTHRSCARKHWYRYELLLRPRKTDNNLSQGHEAHDFQELWWLQERARALAAASVASPVIGALMVGYDARWGEDTQWQSVQVEQEHYVPLLEVDGVELVLGSKLDGVVRHVASDELYVREFKTTAYDVAQGSMYWQSIRLNTQIDTYSLILAKKGIEVSGTLYDVVHKPSLKPQRAVPEHLVRWTKPKPATKNKPAEPSRPYAGQRLVDETEEEFGARVALAIGEAPESFYGRAVIKRTESQIEEFTEELDYYASRIIVAPPHRNADSCLKFNRLCEYHSLCTGYGTEADFDRVPSRHSELTRAGAIEQGEPLE